MGGNRVTGARLPVVRVMLGGEGADSRVKRELEFGSFSVCGGEVLGVLVGVDGVSGSGELGGGGIVAPKSADAAFSLTWWTLLSFGGVVGVLVGDVLVESEAAAKPWTSSFVLGVSRVIASVDKIESG